MKVRFVESYGYYRPGDVARYPTPAACELIKHGIAEQWEPQPPEPPVYGGLLEAATLEPTENAMLPRAKGRRR